jgi:hypothetical protein
MRCPVDNETLVMTERYGIEIDYCPKCRGVWLDRGELDKIIERALAEMDGARPPARAAAAPAFAPPPQHSAPVYQPEPQRGGDRRRDDDDDDHRYKKRRKESFLGELFDF